MTCWMNGPLERTGKPMLIRSLYLEDFRQYRGPNTLDLSLDWGSSRNIILIGGLNGSGKTTLLEALRLAFFGKLNTDLWRGSSYRAFVNKSLNRASAQAGKSFFKLAAEIETGEIHGLNSLRIERCWHVGLGGEPVQESLHLFQDGKEVLGLPQNDAEAYILERLPFELSQFVFFDGEKLYALARQSVLGIQVRDALESVLGIRVYQNLRRDLENHLRYQVRSYTDDDELKMVMSLADRASQHLDTLEQRRNSLLAQLNDSEHELGDLRSEMKRLGNFRLLDRAQLDGLLSVERVARDDIQKRLSDAVSRDLPMLILMPRLAELRSTLEHETLLEQENIVSGLLNSKRELLLREVEKAGWQGSPDDFTKAWDAVFGTDNASSPVRHRHLSVDEKYSLISQIDSLRMSVCGNLDGLVKELEQSDQKVHKIMQDLRAMPNDDMILDLERRERDLTSTIKGLSQELGVLSVEENQARNELASARRSEQAALEKLNMSQQLKRKTVREQAILEAIREFIGRLATDKIAEVQRYLTRMFLSLSDDSDTIREFRVDYESGSVAVIDDLGNKFGVETLSEGEKETFVLSFLWAINKAAVQDLPMVIDTPLARLDSVHRLHVVERFLPEAERQTLVLSTDSEIDEDYAEKLSPFIARSYLLEYDPETQSTRLVPGYFTFGG